MPIGRSVAVSPVKPSERHHARLVLQECLRGNSVLETGDRGAKLVGKRRLERDSAKRRERRCQHAVVGVEPRIAHGDRDAMG